MRKWISRAREIYHQHGALGVIRRILGMAIRLVPLLRPLIPVVYPVRSGDQPRLANSASLRTVLLVVHDARREGAPVLGLNIAEQLSKTHHVITILLGDGELLEDFRRTSRVTVGPMHYRDLRPAYFRSILRRLRKHGNISYALVNSIASQSILPSLSEASILSVLLVHEFLSYMRPLHVLEQTAHLASQIVFPTTLVRDNAERVCPEFGKRDSVILPQGRCLLPPSSAKNHAEGEARIAKAFLSAEGRKRPFVVLGCGTVTYRKGVDLFLACASQILQNAKAGEMRFVWIGGGYDPESDTGYSSYLADQIARSGLSDVVCMEDPVDQLDLAYELADVLFLSSRLEPMSNVAIDAMTLDIPVVCFDHAAGIVEILRSKEETAACIAPYLDVAAAAKIIERLATDPDRYATVSRATGTLARDRFDLGKYVASLDQLAQRSIRSNGAIAPARMSGRGG